MSDLRGTLFEQNSTQQHDDQDNVNIHEHYPIGQKQRTNGGALLHSPFTYVQVLRRHKAESKHVTLAVTQQSCSNLYNPSTPTTHR